MRMNEIFSFILIHSPFFSFFFKDDDNKSISKNFLRRVASDVDIDSDFR